LGNEVVTSDTTGVSPWRFTKGKSSIWIAQNVERRVKNFNGAKFWARGYFVSTVGRDEETIRLYIRNQELQDKQLDQFTLFT
jgi:putative transposase